MPNEDVKRHIADLARRLDVDAAALTAIAHLESALRPHAVVDGRHEPLIRFEGHYFDRRLDGERRERARREGLASPSAGAVANPAGQAARWRLFEHAAAIDRKAACESVSWGMGQVMGAHWAWLGYGDVEALVVEARSGAAGQLRLMGRYLEKAGLLPALRSREWATVARGYNGPGYRANAYDTRLAQAFARFSNAPAVPSSGLPVLRRGARGDAVRRLQGALTDHGHPTAADAVFGPLTQAAVRAFQHRHGLVVDGVVGPATWAALEPTALAPAIDGLLPWLVHQFARFLARLA